ncbi:MAG: T9SS type A sorting domain-containing protein [Bacteroidetes bacterium]|nr:T9SS type A sorting domain-containing protein [Bacteroidota bacterium]
MDALISLSSIKIWPNPFMDLITIKFDKVFSGEIRIVDTFGRVLYKSKIFSNEETIDLRYLTAGCYYVILDGNKSNIKLLKIR